MDLDPLTVDALGKLAQALAQSRQSQPGVVMYPKSSVPPPMLAPMADDSPTQVNGLWQVKMPSGRILTSGTAAEAIIARDRAKAAGLWK